MASPSNKKDGSAYLSSLKKDELVERCIDLVSQITDLETKVQDRDSEIISLTKELDKLKKKVDRYFTKDEIMKKILEYRARNYSPIFIRDKLKLEGIDQSLSSIKNIINSPLNIEMELFYNKCKQEYTESIKINTSLYKQSSIEEFQRLIDSAYEDLENCDSDDIKTRDSLRNSIGKLISQRDTLMKNIDESTEMTEEEEYMNQSFEDYKESSDKIIKLTNVRAIGE